MNFDTRLLEVLNKYNIKQTEVKPLAKDIAKLVTQAIIDMSLLNSGQQQQTYEA